MWSERGESFLVITVHAITADFKLYNACLDLVAFPISHTTQHIWLALQEQLDLFGIGEKISALTTDTAANVAALDTLIPYAWHPCLAHVISLFVSDSAIDCAIPLIDKCRLLVQKFRASKELHYSLRQKQDAAGVRHRSLHLDQATRWNSLHIMLEDLSQVLRAIYFHSCVRKKNDFNLLDSV